MVSKYWIDPKQILTQSDEIKNVIKLGIYGVVMPEEFAMRQINYDFTNVEILELDVMGVLDFILMLSRFRELKNFKTTGGAGFVIRIDYLLDILRFLGDWKTLNISAHFDVLSDLGNEATKDIFSEALEIVREKFPFPDARILMLEIVEGPYVNSYYRNAILLGERGAIFAYNT